MNDYFSKDDGVNVNKEFFEIPKQYQQNNTPNNNNDKTEKYCVYYNIFVNGCKNNECPLYPCKFAEIHKKMVKMFQLEFNTTCEDARRVARTLLLNSYRPNEKEK